MNGAVVNTSFYTNLGAYFIRSAPELTALLQVVDKQSSVRRHPPKYEYPPEVLTATMVGNMSTHQVDFKIRADQCYKVSRLDCQPKGKGIFGSGYLLSKQEAARKTKALQTITTPDDTIRFTLSEREQHVVDELRAKSKALKVSELWHLSVG